MLGLSLLISMVGNFVLTYAAVSLLAEVKVGDGDVLASKSGRVLHTGRIGAAATPLPAKGRRLRLVGGTQPHSNWPGAP